MRERAKSEEHERERKRAGKKGKEGEGRFFLEPLREGEKNPKKLEKEKKRATTPPPLLPLAQPPNGGRE